MILRSTNSIMESLNFAQTPSIEILLIQWMKNIDPALLTYADALQSAGYTSLRAVARITAEDIDYLPYIPPGHKKLSRDWVVTIQ